mmetsp:Transcript_17503/g.26244  ORF Transcript_17503/g.26244 Transcript_17503/m.26244 type:complete len:88 (+) Transcript_17503:82-345(+)
MRTAPGERPDECRLRSCIEGAEAWEKKCGSKSTALHGWLEEGWRWHWSDWRCRSLLCAVKGGQPELCAALRERVELRLGRRWEGQQM